MARPKAVVDKTSVSVRMDAEFKRRAEAVAFDLLAKETTGGVDPRDINLSEWIRSVLDAVMTTHERANGGKHRLEQNLNNERRRALQRDMDAIDEMERHAKSE